MSYSLCSLTRLLCSAMKQKGQTKSVNRVSVVAIAMTYARCRRNATRAPRLDGTFGGMNRPAAFTLAALLAACHFSSDPMPASTELMIAQWRSTDHLITTDMPLSQAASGGEALDGTATFRNYYGPGQDQAFNVSGNINGLTWAYVGPPGAAGFPLGDQTHLSANPTFTVTFRDQNHMLLLSDTNVQIEFLRQ
jgi:hypothetical protein